MFHKGLIVYKSHYIKGFIVHKSLYIQLWTMHSIEAVRNKVLISFFISFFSIS
jgi:hypothetical protein